MMDAAITVRRIVSQRLGGCIFVGRLPDNCELKVVAAAGLTPAIPVPGEVWRVRGELEESGWGRQLRAQALWRAPPPGKLLGDWIVANVSGIGQIKADRLISVFGSGLADVLDDGEPEPLIDILAPAHPNLGARLACALVALWQDQRVSAEIHVWLDRHGIQEPRLARRLAELLGDQAIAEMESNPYTLVGLQPWKVVDALGLRLFAARNDQHGDPARDVRRLVGAVDAAVIERITNHGDTAVPDSMLRRRLAVLLRERIPAADLQRVVAEAIQLGARNRAVITSGPEGSVWRAPGCAMMEELLGRKINDLINLPWRSVIKQRSPEEVQSLVGAVCVEQDINLHPEQKLACTRLLRYPLGVLTGGAGVGKTTTTRAIVAAWETAGGRVELCALSGKAARRLSYATHRLARTIHRLIRELRQRNDRTLTAEQESEVARLDDRTLLVIDEASMVDLGQFTELLVDHLPDGCHVLLIGDPAQLPPIGPGQVFPVVCGLPKIVAELTVVHRQTGASAIPAVSKSVRIGRVPELPAFDPARLNGVSLLACQPQEMELHVRRVVEALGGHGDVGHELLVLSPTNDGAPCSVRQMNRAFQAARRMRFDVDGQAAELPGSWGQQFIVGDPVVFTRNVYRNGLFNGMLGRVVGLLDGQRRLVVHFEDGEDREIG